MSEGYRQLWGNLIPKKNSYHKVHHWEVFGIMVFHLFNSKLFSVLLENVVFLSLDFIPDWNIQKGLLESKCKYETLQKKAKLALEFQFTQN